MWLPLTFRLQLLAFSSAKYCVMCVCSPQRHMLQCLETDFSWALTIDAKLVNTRVRNEDVRMHSRYFYREPYWSVSLWIQIGLLHSNAMNFDNSAACWIICFITNNSWVRSLGTVSMTYLFGLSLVLAVLKILHLNITEAVWSNSFWQQRCTCNIPIIKLFIHAA